MKNTSKNILITGGSGFIGSALAEKLINLKHNVKIFDNNSRGSLSKLKNIIDKVDFVEGDIRNKKDVFSAMKQCECVFHLSFVNGTKFFYEKPELVLEVGLKGALNTLECAKELNIETFIMASSSEIYNEPTKVPTDEKERAIIPDVKNPRFSYASGKLISEILTLNYLRDSNIKDLIFRPHNIFGPNMGFEHVIPDIIKKIFLSSNKFKDKECSIQIQGNGEETRAFCYIKEAIDQLVYILNYGSKGEIYNIGMQKEITIKNLIADIGKVMETNINVISGEMTKGSTRRRCPDISKIQALGYKNKVSYLNGLKSTVEWYKDYYSKNC